MRRRSRASSKLPKARRRKATPKRRTAPTVTRSGKAAVADLQTELKRQARELNEALKQQAATAGVLKVISRSTFDLQTVLNTLVETAARLCEADMGYIARPKGEDSFRHQAGYGLSPALKEYMDRTPIRAGRGSAGGRALLERAAIHIPNARTDSDYKLASPHIGGFHTLVAAPLMREGTPIGVLVLPRRLMRPFTDRQIELLTTFADEAVIAIENVRLFEAEQQRTRELSESLEQQTATSEVLKVISSSPGDLQPVFSAMLESAARLCDASFGNIFRWDDHALRLVATYNTPAAFAGARRESPLRQNQNNPIAEMLAAKTVLHVNDLAADERYTKRRDPNIIAAVELGGIRTFLAVPMLKDNELIGALIVYRQEVHPFSDKQIELVQNFAAQAVIAIENARLLNELRESLEQQNGHRRRAAGYLRLARAGWNLYSVR
jgi:two-component system, NtrC family, sensor kinase